MLRFKPEVRIHEWTRPLDALFDAASRWSVLTQIDVEFNSIDDGVGIHMAGSLHGWSLAADVDTQGDRMADTHDLGEYLRRVLPAPWQIIFEGDHVHAEWDIHRAPLPMKGTP